MRKALSIAVALTMCAGAAQAQTITNGFTFAVASDGGSCGSGSHFHSSTGGDFGNPSGKAEVGSFFDECVRGLSEYDVSGQTSAASAFVTFNAFKSGGLFESENDFPFTGAIDVVAYQGNNTENISDYEATSVASVGSFSTSGLSVGDILSFDITSIFNEAITDGWSSLGIRLQVAPGTDTEGGAWTFDSFRLTADDQSTVPPTSTTPEPASLALLGTGLMGLVGLRRKRRGGTGA